VSRKRSKSALPGDRCVESGAEALAQDYAAAINSAIDPRRKLVIWLHMLIRGVEDASRPLNEAEVQELAKLAHVESAEELDLSNRAGWAGWLRECLAVIEAPPSSAPDKPRRGAPTDPTVDRAASAARFDIDRYDELRALGHPKVPSDQVVLDKTIEREWPDGTPDGEALRKKRRALRQAVLRRRKTAVSGP
jgi:hypothetical protein